MYKPVREGIYYSPKHGRLVEHHKNSVRIYWNPTMLDYLKKYYATTTNEELAGCIGVSQRTMIRKARELGLKKDRDWLIGVWNVNRRMATSAARRKGWPGHFPKGVRVSPEHEYKKGHSESAETKEKRSKALKRWCALHPKEVRERILRACATRKAKL